MVLKEIQNECKHKGEHFINLLLTCHSCQKFKLGNVMQPYRYAPNKRLMFEYRLYEVEQKLSFSL